MKSFFAWSLLNSLFRFYYLEWNHPGDSLDGFRHYEAIVSGAVPVVDAPSNHPHWSWMVNQRQAEAIRASAGASAQKVNGAALHPTQTKTSLENHTEAWSTRGTGVECGLSVPALGWVFPAPLRVETRDRKSTV